ncbi:MAG: glycosyltransferase family 2 protein [Nitrospirota bacterium]|nr:glycosyltransferase family 2 protein [Nitrospirota bacterium]
MPLVSAIIPAYNGASRYLDQAIGSVLAQTCQDLELIVVDDASTDETARLVLQFSRARYFKRPENGGQAAARNDGARLAAGTYLAFLDQDDLWAPSFIEETLALLQAQPEAALVHCDGYQMNEGGAPLHYDAAMKQERTITQLLRGGHDVATSGSLFRKACFDAVGGYDDTLVVWEDIDLAIRLYQRFPLLHLPKPLYRHRLYTRNVSRDIPSERALMGRRRFLEKHASACPPGTQLANALARDWAHYYGDLGKHHLEKRRIGEARCAFWLSLQRYPFNHKAWLRLLRAYLFRSVQTRPAPSRHTP